MNAAIRVLLDELNDRPMKKLGVSRRVLFEQLDRPALRPLPTTRYVLAQWKVCRVNVDYHVEVEDHLYSVPYQLVREQVDVDPDVVDGSPASGGRFRPRRTSRGRPRRAREASSCGPDPASRVVPVKFDPWRGRR